MFLTFSTLPWVAFFMALINAYSLLYTRTSIGLAESVINQLTT